MEEKNRIRMARSRENGIVFYSNIYPNFGINAIINESGEIQTDPIYIPLIENKRSTIKKIFTKKDILKIGKLTVVIDVLLIILSLLAKNFWVSFAAIFFSIMSSLEFFIMIKIVYEIKSKNGKLRSLGRFHAAEHMVINAYNKYKRVPTFEEVKKSSRFSKYCGSNKIICENVLFLSISINLAIIGIIGNGFIKYIFYFIMMCIAFIVIIGYLKGWLNFFQCFSTTPPTDKEIEVAIEGIKAFEELEKYFRKYRIFG